MTGLGRRRWVGRLAFLTALVALVAAMTGLAATSSSASAGLSIPSAEGVPASPPTHAPGSSGASTASPLSSRSGVALDDYNPIASPAVPLALHGHVDLAASESDQDLVVTVSVMSGGVEGRAKLERVRADPTSVAYSQLGDAVAVDAGDQFTFSARLTRSQLTIYPMRIAVHRSGRAGAQVAVAYTFLVWAPPQPSLQATAISTVLPISAPPKLRSDGMLTDNILANDIGPGGRLSTLLEALDPTSRRRSAVALALDPTLLKALAVMAGRDTFGTAMICVKVPAPCYRFASPTGPQERPVSTAAGTFLDHLRAFADTAGNTVFALPWGDVDLTALIRAGQANDALYAVNTGRIVVAAALGRSSPTGDLPASYPIDGLADAATLDLLALADRTTVILDDRLLPANGTMRTATAPSIQQTADGPIRVLAADSRLAAVVTAPSPSQPASGSFQQYAAVQAELAMITAERPTDDRLVVLALPRLWNPPADWARLLLPILATGIGVGGDYQQFFTPAPLPTSPVTPEAMATASSTRTVTYPAWAAAQEIPTSYVDAVEHLRAETALLDPVLCARLSTTAGHATTTSPKDCLLRETVIGPMKDTLMTALSAAWRTSRPGAVPLSQEVDGRITLIRDSIQVIASPKVTLTSRNGTVPLTVENVSTTHAGNTYPMTVVLSLSSNDKTRLRSPSTVALTIEPGEKQQVEVSVSSDSAGTFPVYIQVLTPDGKRLTSEPARILVRSTAYGAIATAITYTTVGLFAAAVLLRLTRRRRRTSLHPGNAAGSQSGPHTIIGVAEMDQGHVSSDLATTPVRRRVQANAGGTRPTE